MTPLAEPTCDHGMRLAVVHGSDGSRPCCPYVVDKHRYLSPHNIHPRSEPVRLVCVHERKRCRKRTCGASWAVEAPARDIITRGHHMRR